MVVLEPAIARSAAAGRLTRRERRRLQRRVRGLLETDLRAREGTSPRRRRRELSLLAAGLVAALAGSAVAPSAAHALTIRYDDVTQTLTVNGGAGNDTIVISCADGRVHVNDSAVRGDPACADVERISVDGRGGDDRIDLAAVTRIEFDPAVAALTGGAGDDWFIASAFDDDLKGGDGNDRLTGGEGNDTMAGGTGVDALVERGDVNFTLTNSSLTGIGIDVLVAIEHASLTGGVSSNTIDASAFAGPVTLIGGTGDDVLLGGAAPDNLVGGQGNDRLEGGEGEDVLRGGRGDDTLVGGPGQDKLIGGQGNDTIQQD